MSELPREAGIQGLKMSELWSGARVVEIETRILAWISRGSKPLAAGGFISYLLLSALALPLVFDWHSWFTETPIPEIALTVLLVKVLLDSGFIWISMTRTLNPKVRQSICPKCNVSMTPNGFSCPTCGGTFSEKK
jgi:hypothetical protein